MRRSLATIALLTGLGGCSLIPDYHRPALPVSTQWPDAAQGGKMTGTPAADLGWRDVFTDPVLQDLIALGLANNRDLRVAALNIAKAEAQYRYDHASLFPTVDAEGQFLRSYAPGEISSASSGAGGNIRPENIREYNLGFGVVSWELDLFGRIRSQASADQETFLSNAETRTATQISLVAQIASAWLTWLADRDALAVAEDSVRTQAESLRLTRIKTDQGTATALDVAQAETTLHDAEAKAAQYTRQVAQDMDALVLVLGATPPPALLARMNAAGGLEVAPPLPELPGGMPSDLLLRRPDIRAAEHTLRAANANIGAARAAFFPQVTLTASGGTSASAVDRLFTAGHAAWSFNPQVTVPIFDAGRNFANLDLAKIEARIEVANYEKAIQSAFRDVADALSARQTYVTQLTAQRRLVDADGRYYSLADMRFRAGADTYLNVLQAQNQLLSARLALIGLHLSALQNTVTLYKALGGGWTEHTVKVAQAQGG
jgi:outer membrane protein, multidrug efflux system